MKIIKIITFVFFFIFMTSCIDTKDAYLSTVNVKLKNSSTKHAFLIEINAVEEPQHLDFVPTGNANIFLTDKHQEVTTTLERNIIYNIKVYSTSLYYDSEIKYNDYKPYILELKYDGEQSFNNREDVFIIDLK